MTRKEFENKTIEHISFLWLSVFTMAITFGVCIILVALKANS